MGPSATNPAISSPPSSGNTSTNPTAAPANPAVTNAFLSGYDEISTAWKDNGYDRPVFHSSLNGLMNLSEDNLNRIDADLANKGRTVEVPAEKKMLGTYESLTRFTIELKKLQDMEDALNGVEDICAQPELLASESVQLEKTESAFEDFANQANEFAIQYREQAEAIQFYELGRSYVDRLEELKTYRNDLQTAQEMCQ